MSENGNRKTASLGVWLAIGTAMGAAIGVANNNVAVWLPIGAVMGVIIGAVASQSARGEG